VATVAIPEDGIHQITVTAEDYHHRVLEIQTLQLVMAATLVAIATGTGAEIVEAMETRVV
jgi:hypothetical protein